MPDIKSIIGDFGVKVRIEPDGQCDMCHREFSKSSPSGETETCLFIFTDETGSNRRGVACWDCIKLAVSLQSAINLYRNFLEPVDEAVKDARS